VSELPTNCYQSSSDLLATLNEQARPNKAWYALPRCQPELRSVTQPLLGPQSSLNLPLLGTASNRLRVRISTLEIYKPTA
jgi:hypothetical protein